MSSLIVSELMKQNELLSNIMDSNKAIINGLSLNSNQKKNVAVVLSGTSNLLFAMANVVIGIEDKSPGFVDDIYIYHDNISLENQKLFQKIRPVNFIKLENELTRMKVIDDASYFTTMCYGIFEIFDLLDNYKNVIYLDCDVIIKKDFRDIINFGPIGIRNTGKKIFQSFKEVPPEITHDFNTRNSGVVVVNDSLDYRGLTEFCYQKTIEQWDNNIFADQAMLTYCLFLKNIQITDLPFKFNNVLGNSKESVIVHCIRKNSKPWNNGIVRNLNPEWDRNNQVWLNLGGEAYSGKENQQYFSDFNFHSTENVTVLTRTFIYFCKSILKEVNENISKLYGEKFIKIWSKPSGLHYYYELSSIDIVRFEIYVKECFVFIKIYTNNNDVKNIINNQYVSLLKDYAIQVHKDGNISFQKKIKIFDMKEATISDVLQNELAGLMSATLIDFRVKNHML